VNGASTESRPSQEHAVDIVTGTLGEAPVDVRRFRTGLHHYVYEATFAARAPFACRRIAMAGAAAGAAGYSAKLASTGT
jgi:hypothetical protein